MTSLAGKVALVTGGGRGIGRAIAEALVHAGAAVAVTYRERQGPADEFVSRTRSAGGHAAAFGADATDRYAMRAAIDRIEHELGGLDVLVNNAGINKPTDFDKITDEDWDSVLAVNLKGPFICAQEALPALRRRGGGRIINIGSVSGQYGGPRTAHYAASKAGLISLGQVIARFGGRDNICCNTIAAGLIASDMAAAALGSPAVAEAAKNILLGRLGTVDEVARVVVFLAGDGGAYITGQTIGVNGGLYF